MPSDQLDRERIIDAALTLLDEVGVDGFNVRVLGSRLGNSPSAMYWHVGSKAQLIALAADRAWREIRLPELASASWRAAAAQMARELRSMLDRHGWLIHALGSLVIAGHGKARYDEHSLALYEQAGFSGPAVDQAAAVVFMFVLGNAIGPAAAAAFARSGGEPGLRAEDLDALAAEFPRLGSRMEAAAAEHGASPAESFEFGLAALLDGFELRLAP